MRDHNEEVKAAVTIWKGKLFSENYEMTSTFWFLMEEISKKKYKLVDFTFCNLIKCQYEANKKVTKEKL